MLIPDTTLEMVWGTRQSWNLACIVPGTQLPFDITGYDLILTVKLQPTDDDPGLFQLSNIAGVARGIAISDAPNGIATATVLPVATLLQPVGGEVIARWDLRLTATNDPTNSQVIARGPFLMHPAVGTSTDV